MNIYILHVMNSNNYYLFIIHVNEQNKSKLIFMFVTAMANCRLYWLGTGGRESKDSKNTCVVVGEYATSTTL